MTTSAILLNSCSDSVQRGFQFLEEQIQQKNIEFHSFNVVVFYVLKKISSHYVDDFIRASIHKDFWWRERGVKGVFYTITSPNNTSPFVWYLLDLALEYQDDKCHNDIEEFVEQIKKEQTVEGHFSTRSIDHASALRILTFLEQDSNSVKNGITYLMEHYQNFSAPQLSTAILALTDLSYWKYEQEIQELLQHVLSQQTKDGYWGNIEMSRKYTIPYPYYPVQDTSTVIMAMTRILKEDAEQLVIAVDWLKGIQQDNGSWNNHSWDTAHALLALFSHGEGVKVSLDKFEWQKLLEIQALKQNLPNESSGMPRNLSRKQLSPTLHNKIIDFLLSLPNVSDSRTLQALLNNAKVDSPLQNQIDLSGPPAHVFSLLVSTLYKYGELDDGRNALICILESAKGLVGQPKKSEGDKLIEELREFVNSEHIS